MWVYQEQTEYDHDTVRTTYGVGWPITLGAVPDVEVIETYDTQAEAAARVHYLNGGSNRALRGIESGITALADAIGALERHLRP